MKRLLKQAFAVEYKLFVVKWKVWARNKYKVLGVTENRRLTNGIVHFVDRKLVDETLEIGENGNN